TLIFYFNQVINNQSWFRNQAMHRDKMLETFVQEIQNTNLSIIEEIKKQETYRVQQEAFLKEFKVFIEKTKGKNNSLMKFVKNRASDLALVVATIALAIYLIKENIRKKPSAIKLNDEISEAVVNEEVLRELDLLFSKREANIYTNILEF